MIKGDVISLKPAEKEHKDMVYTWTCKSDITCYLFGNQEIPTKEEFFEDYVDCYFNGSDPFVGRGFLIMVYEKPIGFISYSSSHLKSNKAELDLWMNSEKDCGKGYGPDAIKTLCYYLKNTLNINQFIILPSIQNARAIKAYEKAGFQKVEMDRKIEVCKNFLTKEEFEEYDDDSDYKNSQNVLLTMKV